MVIRMNSMEILILDRNNSIFPISDQRGEMESLQLFQSPHPQTIMCRPRNSEAQCTGTRKENWEVSPWEGRMGLVILFFPTGKKHLYLLLT